MPVHTATGGKADWALGGGTNFVNIPEVRKWTLTISNEAKTYASSSTAGGKRRLPGAEDFSGSLDIYIESGTNRADADNLGIRSGAAGTFRLYEDDNNFWDAPAIIGNPTYNVDIEGNNIVEGTIPFDRDGALVYPSDQT
jgi:hypothetical protein